MIARRSCNCPHFGITCVPNCQCLCHGLQPPEYAKREAQALPLIDGPEGIAQNLPHFLDTNTASEGRDSAYVTGSGSTVGPAPGTGSQREEREDSFSLAMARIEELREANRERLQRRDRAEWECFMHFACENSLFKRQA